MHGRASRGPALAALQMDYTGCRRHHLSTKDRGKGRRPAHVGILTADGSIIHAAEGTERDTGVGGVHPSPRESRSQHVPGGGGQPVHGQPPAPAAGRRSGCWHGPLQNAHPVPNVTVDPYCPDWCMMQTLVVVFWTIYGVSFNGRGMTPAENRDTALASKGAFDCLLTQSWLSHVLTLCSTRSREERMVDPVALM